MLQKRWASLVAPVCLLLVFHVGEAYAFFWPTAWPLAQLAASHGRLGLGRLLLRKSEQARANMAMNIRRDEKVSKDVAQGGIGIGLGDFWWAKLSIKFFLFLLSLGRICCHDVHPILRKCS